MERGPPRAGGDHDAQAPAGPNWRRRAVDLEVAAYARSRPSVVGAGRQRGHRRGPDRRRQRLRRRHGREPPVDPPRLHDQHADVVGGRRRRARRRSVPEAVFHNGRGLRRLLDLPFTAGPPSPTNGAPFDAAGRHHVPARLQHHLLPAGLHLGHGPARPLHQLRRPCPGLRAGHEAAWPARDALAAHLTGQQALVAGNGTGDGRTYNFELPVANAQESYPGREEYAASQLAAGLAGPVRRRNAWDKTSTSRR